VDGQSAVLSLVPGFIGVRTGEQSVKWKQPSQGCTGAGRAVKCDLGSPS
jgi:hypothetical protein